MGLQYRLLAHISEVTLSRPTGGMGDPRGICRDLIGLGLQYRLLRHIIAARFDGLALVPIVDSSKCTCGDRVQCFGFCAKIWSTVRCVDP